MFLVLASLIQEESRGKAYDFGFQVGYFIGQYSLYLLIGFVLAVALFIYFFFIKKKRQQV